MCLAVLPRTGGGWELKQLKALNHHLPTIWEKFKMCSNDSSLSAHDGVIDLLSEFEEIRYPDSVVKHGIV